VLRYLQPALPPEFAEEAAPLAVVISASLSAATWRAYRSHLSKFFAFCAERDLSFLPASPSTVLLYAGHLASEGSIQATTAQPYFSAINTYHDLLGFPKPAVDFPPLHRFRVGWQRLQQPVGPAAPLQLAMRASSAVALARHLSAEMSLPRLRPLLFVVLGFLTMLRPDSLLSVLDADIVAHGPQSLWAYRPARWKGKLLAPGALPVLQVVVSAVPGLLTGLRRYRQLWGAAWVGCGPPTSFWQLPHDRTVPHTPVAEAWFSQVMYDWLPGLAHTHTLYSLRRGSASAAFAIGVPCEKIEFLVDGLCILLLFGSIIWTCRSQPTPPLKPSSVGYCVGLRRLLRPSSFCDFLLSPLLAFSELCGRRAKNNAWSLVTGVILLQS
jgi:hypothetical protein